MQGSKQRREITVLKAWNYAQIHLHHNDFSSLFWVLFLLVKTKSFFKFTSKTIFHESGKLLFQKVFYCYFLLVPLLGLLVENRLTLFFCRHIFLYLMNQWKAAHHLFSKCTNVAKSTGEVNQVKKYRRSNQVKKYRRSNQV